MEDGRIAIVDAAECMNARGEAHAHDASAIQATAAGVLIADPPWRFGDQLPGGGRGAAKHYATLSVDEICAFPLPRFEDGPLLFLWRVAAMQEEALRVCRAWGFTPSTELVWCKPQIGMGHYVRNAHEVCLIGTRKGSTRRILSHAIPSHFTARRGAHSAKPDEFYAIVERLTRGPHVELFARRRREGWTCFGNELPVAA